MQISTYNIHSTYIVIFVTIQIVKLFRIEFKYVCAVIFLPFSFQQRTTLSTTILHQHLFYPICGGFSLCDNVSHPVPWNWISWLFGTHVWPPKSNKTYEIPLSFIGLGWPKHYSLYSYWKSHCGKEMAEKNCSFCYPKNSPKEQISKYSNGHGWWRMALCITYEYTFMTLFYRKYK